MPALTMKTAVTESQAMVRAWKIPPMVDRVGGRQLLQAAVTDHHPPLAGSAELATVMRVQF